MNARSRVLLSLVAVVGLAIAQSAVATTDYGTFVGGNVTFTGIPTVPGSGVLETSTFGDPEPLFGAPTLGGVGNNSLLFFPTSFSASAAGGGFDQTGSQLQTTIMGNTALDTITQVNITEFGDTLLAGAGTAATGTFAGMSGLLTVTETTAGVLGTPIVIGWTGSFSPTDTFDLISNPGITIWSGSVSIDVTAELAAQGVFDAATKAVLSYDNNLFAFSEPGTSSLIQKKVVTGPSVIIEVIPEPGTAVLFGLGLLCLGLRSRRARAE